MDKTAAPDSRYPYTYAADLIRSCAVEGGVKLSRGDAVYIGETIATAIGMGWRDLAVRLADFYLQRSDEIADRFFAGLPGFGGTDDGR